MKKDLAKVKVYAEAMVDSNHVRDAYVNKEQDKFFHCLNRQQNNIDALKDRMEWLELMSGPLYPNAPSALFCAFPRPASPTSSTYPVGCPSPTEVKSIE